MNMGLSDNGLKFIKNHEGKYLYWYELNDGGLTCGYGHWVPHATAAKIGIKKGDKITQKQADDYLRQDMQKFINYTNSIVKTYGFTGKLNQNQFDSLVSYCFNRGPGNAAGSNGLRQLLKNSKTVTDISKNFMIYWGTNQTYKKGLLNRRKAEQTLFNTKVSIKTEHGVDKLEFTSATTKNAVRDDIQQAVNKKLIEGFWLDRFDNGTMTNGDYDGIKLITAQRSVTK